jgi:hypothetical protein
MKSILQNMDTIQLSGFLISAFVALALIFTGNDSISSAILGFVLAILTQLFDIQKRQNDIEQRILRANALSQNLYKDDWLLQRIEHIISDYDIVRGKWYEGFRIRAKNAITDCYEVIHGLAEGYMIVGPKSPFSFGILGIKDAEKTLKAVTLSDSSFWDGIYGENFLKANADAMKRGVKIVRIFMNTPESLRAIEASIRKQHEMGIDVYVLATEDIPKQLHDDVVIMDDRYLNKTEFTGSGKVKEWRITIDPIEVEQACRKFDAVLRAARKPAWLLNGKEQLKTNAA